MSGLKGIPIGFLLTAIQQHLALLEAEGFVLRCRGKGQGEAKLIQWKQLFNRISFTGVNMSNHLSIHACH